MAVISPKPRNRASWDDEAGEAQSWRPEYRWPQSVYTMQTPHGDSVFTPEQYDTPDQLWSSMRGPEPEELRSGPRRNVENIGGPMDNDQAAAEWIRAAINAMFGPGTLQAPARPPATPPNFAGEYDHPPDFDQTFAPGPQPLDPRIRNFMPLLDAVSNRPPAQTPMEQEARFRTGLETPSLGFILSQGVKPR